MNKEVRKVKENIDKIGELLYETAKIIATNQEIKWTDLMYYSCDDVNCAMKIYNYHDLIMDIRVMSGMSKSKIPKEERAKKYIEYIEYNI